MSQMFGKSLGMTALQVAEAFRYRQAYSQRWHAHAGKVEIHCVFSGAITYKFEGERLVTIPGGCFLVIPDGVPHGAVTGEGVPAVRLDTRWRARPAPGDLRLCPFTGVELKALLADLVATPCVVRRMPRQLVRAARELFNQVENGGADATRRLSAWTFLAEAAAAAKVVEPPPQLTEDIVGDICTYIREHCSERIRIDGLAQMSGYSRRRLFDLFHQSTGLSPANYLTRCRITRAKEMMAATPRPRLLDVALGCGFSSPSHFAAVFKKYTRQTPRAYLVE